MLIADGGRRRGKQKGPLDLVGLAAAGETGRIRQAKRFDGESKDDQS